MVVAVTGGSDGGAGGGNENIASCFVAALWADRGFFEGPIGFHSIWEGGSFLNFLSFVSCVSWRCRQQTKQECCGCPTTRNQKPPSFNHHISLPTEKEKKKKTLEAQEFNQLYIKGEITPKQKRKNIFGAQNSKR